MRYLQLEKGESIDKGEIIGIFDIETASKGESTRDFFRRQEDQTSVISLSNDLPKSFLVCDNEFGDRMYITGISTESIKKRIDSEIKTLWSRD